MAVFNPGVAPGKDDMPNYFKYSSPISGVEADKSSAIATQTVGTAIEGGAALAETTAKDIIGKDVRETVEPIREDFTKTLEAARNAQKSSVVPAPVQGDEGSTAPSLTGPAKEEVPAAINSGLGKIDSLQSALVNGKINDTYYDLRLKAAVTDLRTKYPGFVDLIDQKVSQITGVNPANAYISNLMQDINRAQTSKKTELDKEMDLARQAMTRGNFIPGADTQLDRLQKLGESYIPTFRKWYTDENAKWNKLQWREELRKDQKGSKEEIVEQRKSDWTNEVGAGVQSAMKSIVTVPGLDTPQGILDTIQKAAAQPSQYTDAQMTALAGKIAAQKLTLETQYRARAAEVAKDNQGRTYSYNSDIGSDQSLKIMQDQLSIFDSMGDALMKGGVNGAGVAFAHARHAVALLNDSKDNLLSGDVGKYAAKVSNFNELFGPNWTNLVVTQGLKNNIDEKMRGLLDEKTMDARLQPEFNSTGKPITLKQHMDEALKLEQQGKITKGMRSRYINSLVNVVDDIKNKNAPDADKINVLKYLFSPEGQDILGSNGIGIDYKDPDTGKDIPGKYSVFTRLTSDDVVSEVARLSKSDPKIGQMYKNYMEKEAGSNLFYKEMGNLNQFTGHDNLHFKYNDGGGKGVPNIELIDNQGALASPVGQKAAPYAGSVTPAPQANYIFQVQKIVNRVNDALAGMSRVEKGFGGDASDYALSFLIRSQVDLGKNWEGLPAKLVESIASSRGKRKLEDTFKEQGSK